MEGAALGENRAGITFGVELYISWDPPEAVVVLQQVARSCSIFEVT